MKKISLFISVLFFSQILAAQNEVGLKDSTVIRAREVKLKEPFLGKAWLSVDGERQDLRGVDYYRNEEHLKTVNETLEELGAREKPTLLVFNKIDLYREKYFDKLLDPETKVEIEKELSMNLSYEYGHDNVFVSALDKDNLEILKKR